MTSKPAGIVKVLLWRRFKSIFCQQIFEANLFEQLDKQSKWLETRAEGDNTTLRKQLLSVLLNRARHQPKEVMTVEH